ncbi:MAG TPA: FAD-binding oxidoreductase [Casimicrobiaceae bacterium]|nr:FAD-binding oxidoreductase [Casimicrobiaceae bacterium]
MAIPTRSKYVVIGAGIHGLSSAWHLAKRLRATGRGSGADVIVLEKSRVGAGASGIACGVVRNNYFQPAMRRLMAHCVSVWESDPEAFAYHNVGYMQISPEVMHEGVATIYAQQKEIDYPSTLIEGEADCARYMRSLFDDWQAQGITSVLHEKKGGYSNSKKALAGLAAKAKGEGVNIVTGARVSGFRKDARGAVTHVITDQGAVACEQVIIGAGPWIKQIWDMLELPAAITIRGRDGRLHENVPMWTFWSLQEGTLGVDPLLQRTNDGAMPPVIHVDTDAPLYSDEDGSLVTDELWGIYYKPDFAFGGVQGGAMPFKVKAPPESVKIDPYGPESPDFIVGPDFARMWVSALAFCQKRFEGTMPRYRREPSGGIGSFTADSFPVFDRFCDNVYVIADSNHGWKMIGVGQLVANELCGERSDLLEPFRFARFAKGDLHPTSTSPFPWS